jgi:WD40 repeat protein
LSPPRNGCKNIPPATAKSASSASALAASCPTLSPCAVFSPDGATLVALEDKAAVVFAVSSGEHLARLAIPLRGEDDQSGLTSAAIFSASGAHCWFLDRTGTATRYDTRTWQPLGPPLRHPSAPSAYDFGFTLSADDRWLATFDSPGENGPKAHLQLWDIAAGKALGKPLIAVNGLEGRFLPDQPRVLIAPGRGDATIRELPSLKSSATIRPHDEVEGPSVKISPDGKWLISWGSDRIVCVLDARTGTVKDSQTFHATISQVLLAPDSTGAILAFDNSTFFLQDHHDHYLVRLRFPQAEVAAVHRFTAQQRHAALSPDGRRLLAIVGEADRERLLLFDASTLKTIESPKP